jgi:hypothetical protein
MKFTPPGITVRITPSLGIPEPGCPLPWKFQGQCNPTPRNSKVNVPPPQEIPKLMYPLPWKFES